MIIATARELGQETRVAITPTAVKNYIKLGFDVACEHNAGLLSGFNDNEYETLGATIFSDRQSLLKKADIFVCVNEPTPTDLIGLSPHALLISHIDHEPQNDLLTWCCQQQISVFSMNHIPRISRAQNIDSLSSQANIAGYRAWHHLQTE